MIIDRKIARNSGASLEPCIYKSGHGVYEQGLKMRVYPAVFVPVLGFAMTQNKFTGYIMPVMAEPLDASDLKSALLRLAKLWRSSPGGYGWASFPPVTSRLQHHEAQVAPFTDVHPVLRDAAEWWYGLTNTTQGHEATVIHGDPTTENYTRGGWWLDPSIRTMPAEAELDGGKLLQSYFGYGQGLQFGNRLLIREFLHEQQLDIDLCLYYMVTHVVRLYRIQEHARPWALDLLENLDSNQLVKELRCK